MKVDSRYITSKDVRINSYEFNRYDRNHLSKIAYLNIK